jgi:hypothetical protein
VLSGVDVAAGAVAGGVVCGGVVAGAVVFGGSAGGVLDGVDGVDCAHTVVAIANTKPANMPPFELFNPVVMTSPRDLTLTLPL